MSRPTAATVADRYRIDCFVVNDGRMVGSLSHLIGAAPPRPRPADATIMLRSIDRSTAMYNRECCMSLCLSVCCLSGVLSGQSSARVHEAPVVTVRIYAS